ncbi:MAG TPA: transposase, partial [Terriglobales bacterium]|nr:transposase [Terriglobales bacterium]
MPSGLKRFQNTKQTHFVTFTCYHHRPNLSTVASRDLFESSLECVRIIFQLRIFGYVVMPDHVHLLVSEPDRRTLADALKSLKQSVSRRLINHEDHGGPFKPDFGLSGVKAEHFWQKRYYDLNIRDHDQFVEKLRYIHRNP